MRRPLRVTAFRPECGRETHKPVKHCARIVTHLGFEQPSADQGINFSLAQLDHQAAEPISATLSMTSHTFGCGGACRPFGRWRRCHFSASIGTPPQSAGTGTLGQGVARAAGDIFGDF
jgi:hypothetical protein